MAMKKSVYLPLPPARGYNIGINKIAKISIGISEGALRNVVNWCFSLKNIQFANNKIVAMIDKLSLANAFKKNVNCSVNHTRQVKGLWALILVNPKLKLCLYGIYL